MADDAPEITAHRKRGLARKTPTVQLLRMTKPHHSERTGSGSDRAAEASVRIGTYAAFDARITGAGLLSVGALVSSILLSTAVVIVAARHKGARRQSAMRVIEDR